MAIILAIVILSLSGASSGRDITAVHQALYEQKNGHGPTRAEALASPVREGRLDIFIQPHTHDDVGRSFRQAVVIVPTMWKMIFEMNTDTDTLPSLRLAPDAPGIL